MTNVMSVGSLSIEDETIEGSALCESESAMPIDEVPELTDEVRVAIAEETVCALFEKVPGCKNIIVATMEFCRQPRSVPDVDAFMEGERARNYVIYTPVELRAIMEESQALVYRPAQSEASGEDAAMARKSEEASESPAEMPVDGDGNLVVEDVPDGTWQTTSAGIAYCDRDSFGEHLQNLMRKDQAYRAIYLRLLQNLAQSPLPKTDIDALIDSDPLVQSPRRFAGYFLSELEKGDAVEWNKTAWSLTPRGGRLLAQLQMTNEGA